jgi:GT2 family glycosyltransferase
VTAPPSLQVQTVLFDAELSSVRRFIESFAAASALAQRENKVGRVDIVLGDSSASPLFQDENLEQLEVLNPFECIRYQFFDANLGSAGGHNRLFDELQRDLVLVVNPDTYASPRLVCELVTGLEDTSVGVVEARQLPLEHPKDHDPRTGDTSWASGACFMARAQVVRDIGGFDPEIFFLYCDDVDFSWRAKLHGWRVVHRPSARVFHDKRLSDEGIILPGAEEVRYSAEAAVLLAWRYSRPDLAWKTLEALATSPHPVHRQVAASLRLRLQSDAALSPIDAEHRVGQFHNGEYAVHRFSYADE